MFVTLYQESGSVPDSAGFPIFERASFFDPDNAESLQSLLTNAAKRVQNDLTPDPLAKRPKVDDTAASVADSGVGSMTQSNLKDNSFDNNDDFDDDFDESWLDE